MLSVCQSSNGSYISTYIYKQYGAMISSDDLKIRTVSESIENKGIER